MLVQKDGLSRNIDPARLAEYQAKGYAAADKRPPAPGDKEAAPHVGKTTKPGRARG